MQGAHIFCLIEVCISSSLRSSLTSSNITINAKTISQKIVLDQLRLGDNVSGEGLGNRMPCFHAGTLTTCQDSNRWKMIYFSPSKHQKRFISKRMSRRMRLIVVYSVIKCAKRSDWLCQHSGSGPGKCATVTRLFFGHPHTVWHVRLLFSRDPPKSGERP